MARTKGRRQHLMTAAISIFSRYGYHEAGIREIAQEAKCAVGTFYVYFTSKSDVFLALIDALYSAVMDEVMTGRKDLALAEEKLARSLDRVVGTLLQQRDLARVVLVTTLGSEPVVENHLWNIRQTFAELLATQLQECGIPSERAQIGAWAFVGALAEIFSIWARRPEQSLEAMTQGVRDLFWHAWGLRLSSTSSPPSSS